jgi:uncharacterized surface protein with fasciclin (FAS1) repeats
MSRLSRAMLRAGLAVGLATATVAPAIAQAGTATPPPPAQPTIATLLAPYAGGFDANNNNFNIATHLVLKFPDLVTAATKAGSSTVFLPTDYAFRRLVIDLTGKVVVPEQTLFDSVMKLGPATLGKVVRYHVVKGVALTYLQLVKANDTTIKTAQGGQIRVFLPVDGRRFLYLQDLAPARLDAKIIRADLRASNGILHVVDRVLLPANI